MIEKGGRERKEICLFCCFHCRTCPSPVSVLTLMAISIERYQAIVHPLQFTGTKQRARILILSVWILSLLLVLPGHCIASSHPITEGRTEADYMTTNWLAEEEENIDSLFLFRCHHDDLESTIRRSHFQHLLDLVTYPDAFLCLARALWDVPSCQWNAPPLFDLLYQLHISLFLFVIPLCFMVFTYSGIARVLWGSLPTERMFSQERRVTISNPPTYSGRVSLGPRQRAKDSCSQTNLNWMHHGKVEVAWTIQANRPI